MSNLFKSTRKDGSYIRARIGQHGGHLHCTDGPAVVSADGTKFWVVNGKLHRTDGPAIEYSNGGKVWYLDGVWMTEDDYTKRVSILRSL